MIFILNEYLPNLEISERSCDGFYCIVDQINTALRLFLSRNVTCLVSPTRSLLPSGHPGRHVCPTSGRFDPDRGAQKLPQESLHIG